MSMSEASTLRIKKIGELDIMVDVCKHRRHGVEENIKNGIVVPILECLGWDNPRDMDFEHRKDDGSADILLRDEGKMKLVVECKSIEVKIERTRTQSIDYAYHRGTKFAVLTNGITWEILPTFVEGVPPEKIIPYFKFTLAQIIESPEFIYELISKDSMERLEKAVSKKEDALRKRVDESYFLESLNGFRFRVYQLLRDHFNEAYDKDLQFTESVNDWIKKTNANKDWNWIKEADVNMDFYDLVHNLLESKGIKVDKTNLKKNFGGNGSKDKNAMEIIRNAGIPADWIDKLCFEGAYALINRVIFLRMYEDRMNDIPFTNYIIDTLTDDMSSEDLSAVIKTLFTKVASRFPSMYKVPLYDGINISDVKWEASVFKDILQHTQEHNFSLIDRDLLGDVYQNHTPRQIRKAFGQFYTDPALARYMVERVDSLRKLSDEHIIVDPACGSGTFLLAAYDLLKARLIENGIEQGPAHKHILEQALVGIDIDSFAVQLATMNLLLRDTNTAADPKGIVQGNSVAENLSGYGERNEKNGEDNPRGINELLSEIKKNSPEGIEVVIGNPPHHPISSKLSEYLPVFEGYFKGLSNGLANIASLFLIRWLQKLSPKGILSFILPKAFIWNESYSKVRNYVSRNFKIIEIVDLGKAWDEVGLEQIIIFLQKPDRGEELKLTHEVSIISGVEDPNMLVDKQAMVHYLNQSSLAPEGTIWRLYEHDASFPEMGNFWRRIEDKAERLGNISKIFRGYAKSTVESISTSRRSSTSQKICLAGHNIGYTRKFTCWTLILDKVIWANPDNLSISKPSNNSKDKLTLMKKPKIVCKRLVSSDVKVDAYLDIKGEYFSIDTITNVVLNDDNEYDLSFIYGVLNSIVGTLYLRDIVFNRSTLTMDLDTAYLGKLPIPKVPRNIQLVIGSKAKAIQDNAMSLKSSERANAARRLGGLIEDLDHLVLSAFGENEMYNDLRLLRNPAGDLEQTSLSEFNEENLE